MNPQALNILKYQFEDLKRDPPLNEGVSIGLVGNNFFHWRFTLRGPDDSPYRNGIFNLEMKFPPDFPINKPEVIYITPIYHLNVKHTIAKSQNEEPLGHVCLSSLNWWRPNITIRQLIKEIFALFYLANPDSPFGIDRAKLFRNNREEYDSKCRKYTKKYADFCSFGINTQNGWVFD